jgi:hypothetical protein
LGGAAPTFIAQGVDRIDDPQLFGVDDLARVLIAC